MLPSFDNDPHFPPVCPSLPVQGGAGGTELFREGVNGRGPLCFEAFIMDCTRFASATPCGFAFPPGTARLLIRRQ